MSTSGDSDPLTAAPRVVTNGPGKRGHERHPDPGETKTALRRTAAALRKIISTAALQDCAILLIVALVSLTWFRSAELIATPDSNFPLDIPSTVDRYFEIWEYRSIPGQTDARKFAYLVPWALLLKLWSAASLPFDPGLFQRVLVLGLLWASQVSAYALFRVLARQLSLESYSRRMGGILAGFLYGFNFFSMLTIWSTLAFLMFAYAFLPLILALVLLGLEKRWRTRHAAAIAVVWTLTLSPAYITTPVAITDWASVWVVALVAGIASEAPRRRVVEGVSFVGKIALFWAVLNFHWLLMDVTIGTTELAKYASTTNLFAWNAAPLVDALRLSGYQGLEDYYRDSRLFPWAEWYHNPWIIVLGYVPTALALIGLARRRTPSTLAMGVILAIGLFLVKGPLPPFGSVNDSLFPPGFLATVFRSTYQRFMGYVALAVALLAPIGAIVLADLWPRLNRSRVGRDRSAIPMDRARTAAVLAGIVFVSSVYVAPLLTGAIYENEGAIPSYRVTLPPSWSDLANWLSGQDGTFSVLPFPYPITSAITTLRFANGSEGFLGLYPLIPLASNPIAMGPGPGAELARLLARGFMTDARALNMLNVRFVLAHLDANMVDLEGSPHWVMTPPDALVAALNATPGLTFVRSFGEILVYENQRWSSTELLWLPDRFDSMNPYPAFVWNGPLAPVVQWEAVEADGRRTLGDQIVKIPLAPSFSINNTSDNFGVSLWERQDLAERRLPFWIERSPTGTPLAAWTRYERWAEDQRVRVYSADHVLTSDEPSSVFSDLFDSFETRPFQRWSVDGSWTVSTGLAVDGLGSAVGGPTPSSLTSDVNLTSGVFEGWFRFGENTTNHYPFLPADPSGNLNYWAVALETGEWGYFDGFDYRPYPIRKAYGPDSWLSLRIEFNLTRGLFWTFVDGELLTPGGLPSINAEGSSGSHIINVRLQNAGSNAMGTMWADAVRIRSGALPEVTLSLVNARSISLNPQPLNHEAAGGSRSEIVSHLDLSPGMTLVLLRSYNPGWTIEINGARLPETSHFVAFGQWNGWLVESGGPSTIRIRFTPQAVWEGAFQFSAVAMIATALLLPVRRRPSTRHARDRNTQRPTLLIVSPALVGGSWVLINELAGRLRNRMDIIISAVGPASRTVPESRCYRIPWLDYEEYGPNIDRSILALLWFEAPLLVLSVYLWIRYRPRIWLGNGLLSSALGIIPQKIIGGRIVVSYNAYMGPDAETESRRRMARRVTHHSSMVLVNSRGSLTDAQALASSEKILVLPHSADDVFFEDGDPRALREELGIEDRLVVLFVGRLDQEKHCDFLLRVAQLADPDRSRFVFAGNGPLAAEIQARAESCRNVLYLGRVTNRARLRDVYQMADIAWTYADETYLAKPAVEALASGTPIMVADSPAITAKAARNARIDPALVPEGVGWLVELDSPARVARFIEALDGPQTPWVEIRQQCRQHAIERYSSRNADLAVAGILSLAEISRVDDGPEANEDPVG